MPRTNPEGAGEPMDDRERDELLERIYRTGSAVGGSMPETIDLEEETVPIREFFFEVSSDDELREAEREHVEEILSFLRRKRWGLVQQIRKNEVAYERGTELVPKIQALDRAIEAFESLDDPGLEEQVRREKIKSAQELVDLMREFGKR